MSRPPYDDQYRMDSGRAVSSANAYNPSQRPASPTYSLESHHDDHDPAYNRPYDNAYHSYQPYQSQYPQYPQQSTSGSHPDIPPVPPPHSRSLSQEDTSYHGQQASYADNPYSSRGYDDSYPPSSYTPSAAERGHRNPFSSTSTLGGPSGAALAAGSTSRLNSSHLSTERPGLGRPLSTEYSNYPTSSNSRHGENSFGVIDPMELADDDDDPWSTTRKSKKGLFGSAAAGAGAGVAAAGLSKTARDTSGSYNPVGATSYDTEKSAWLAAEKSRMKRRKFIVFGSIGLIILLAIAGGVVGIVFSLNKSSGSKSANAADDNGGKLLTKDSDQIKALLNNKDLHKVFPGMDYTPLNSQYPDCLHNPPTQNNITRDIAVISQLSPQIRLYGTDCNQTAMVYEAIDILGLKNDMRLWLGVWQDGNSTTNKRQLDQLYDAMDIPGMKDVTSGIFVGNEVLFSKYMTETELLKVISDVRTQATTKGYNVPVGTSDLGSNWNTNYASGVDFVGANIHPFFAGIGVDLAAGWTYEFWQNNNVKLTAGTSKKQIISEVGWPSQGGNDCTDGKGTNVKCASPTAGAVAGIDQMNKFMGDFVCQSLENGTTYFWFEAFDEPWKIRYNTPDEGWEDHWGLMDVDRNLKDGLKIPDCGGKTATF